MDQMQLKPTTFGGYQKKSVHSFLFELTENAQEEQQKLNERIEELTAELSGRNQVAEEAEGKIAAIQQSLDMVNDSLAVETKKNEELTAELEPLRAQIKQQQELLAQKDAEIARLSGEVQNRPMQPMQAVQPVAAMQPPQQGYDAAAAQINRMISQARTDADAILNEARREASSIVGAVKAKSDSVLNNAHSEAGGILSQARAKAAGMINEAKAAAQAQARSAAAAYEDAHKQFNVFCADFNNLRQTFQDATNNMNARMLNVSDAIQKTQSNNPARMETAVSLNFPGENTALPSQSADIADQIFSQYGIHKDDSGFFRLAPEDQR